MLGRLFKQNNNTTQPHNPHHQPPIQSSSNPTTPPALTSSYEDSYTREILYGTHNANQLKPYQFNSKLFRIIISQDGGNLRTSRFCMIVPTMRAIFTHQQNPNHILA